MAELHPAGLGTLVRQMLTEYEERGSVFGLARKYWHYPTKGADTSVRFHGQSAATPLGPAAGPHTQMAQNIVLSWLGGSRIIELKTIQKNDTLKIPRPCIDAANVGYNVEWSQELKLHDSLREYVSASMLIDIIKSEFFPDASDPFFDTVFDMSVGYDFAGVKSTAVRRWLDSMIDATMIIEELKSTIPEGYSHLANLPYRMHISDSVTLSTFHGCPSGEIRSICKFLLTEVGVDVVVKMNPTLLGKNEVDGLLHDVMGYRDIITGKESFDNDIRFDEAVDLTGSLAGTAHRDGRSFGVKFSNTLVVENHRNYFQDELMYMSGQPLHVITTQLVEKFRKTAGTDIPVSFSAGIDRLNFADAVSANMTPVTVCTDLLRPGGYTRLHKYMQRLIDRMKQLGARNIAEYILKSSPGAQTAAEATALGTCRLANAAAADPRYGAEANGIFPKKIGSKLHLFDCINCDKCLPVCPNWANFSYEITPFDVEFETLIYDGEKVQAQSGGRFVIKEAHQIANWADFCNDCGNCDVFCPEDGGPFVEKPRLFSRRETYNAHIDLDGFLLHRSDSGIALSGRMGGREYELFSESNGDYFFGDEFISVPVKNGAPLPSSAKVHESCRSGHTISMKYYLIMKTLLNGLTSADAVNLAAFSVED